MLPVKTRAGVGFAARRNIRMTDDIGDRVARAQRLRQVCECGVLGIVKSAIVRTFELNTNGKIVAATTPLPTGDARVPGAPQA